MSLRDQGLFKLSAVSHRQVTDVHLLGLASTKGGRLATFDRRIPLGAVVGGGLERLEVVPV